MILPEPIEPTHSPAYTLARHIWDNCQQATAHSWRRLNAAMHEAVSLAIRAGLHFDRTDFSLIFAEMRGDYWFGYSPEQRGEGLYKLAVEYANLSACASFEAWKGRPPFIYGGRRLTCDSTIEHFGGLFRARLTSFADDGQSIVLCTYKERDDAIDRRVRVTVEEVRAAERERVVKVALDNFLTDMRRADLAIDPEQAKSWTKKQRAEVEEWATQRRYSRDAPPDFLAAAILETA